VDSILGKYTVDGQIIEYSIKGKQGEPVLVLYGGHSSCFEEFGYDSLIKNDFAVITPSRAGYGKTSKEIGESLSTACACYLLEGIWSKWERKHFQDHALVIVKT